MKNTLKNVITYLFNFLLFIGLLLGCSKSTSPNVESVSPDMQEVEEVEDESTASNPVLFSVIGDVPYSDEERTALINNVQAHNSDKTSKFVVHVGDIKSDGSPCDEDVYKDVSLILGELEAPTFVMLGDNEYNDCTEPAIALEYWNENFLKFNEKRIFEPEVTFQNDRLENFKWEDNKILFIGINIVGSDVHNAEEWQNRLSDNAEWIEQILTQENLGIKAAVIFAHANIIENFPERYATFTERFKASAASFNRPLLYIHGEGHSWIKDNPWGIDNMERIQIKGGSEAVQFTIDPSMDNPFSFDRNFLN